MSDSTTPRVTNNSAAGQFEIHTDSGIAALRYLRDGGMLDLIHTEVPAAFEGKGYGKALVEAALTFARDEKMKIIPSCSFVKHYVETHPETASLVAPARHHR